MSSKFGGKKKKRSANSSFHSSKREMIYKNGNDQEYGFVEKLLGDMRCNVILNDKSTIICKIKGSFKRRLWINIGDIVLISRRSFEDKGDIIYKYTADEAEHLKNMGELNLEKDEDEMNHNLVLLNEQENEDQEDIDLQDL